jgi:hypothetical protein
MLEHLEEIAWDGMHGVKLAAALLALAVLSAGCGPKQPPPQETIQISFLEVDSSLTSTINFLKRRGCNEHALACFAKSVRHYNSTPLAFDLSRFPRAANGAFTFGSSASLIAAMPYKLRDTPHLFELNCFDAVIALTTGQLRSRLKPDDMFGVSLAPALGTNGQVMLLPTPTAREAFAWSCPSWYQDVSRPFVLEEAINSRINLTVALYGFYLFPSSTQSTNLAAKVLETLRTNWNRQGIMFPEKCEVVLCHEVHSAKCTISTFHAGLLFNRKEGFTYLEKDSGCGPFVRLDFEAKSALLPWLAAKCERHELDGPNSFFVTFNRDEILELSVPGMGSRQMTRLLSQPNQQPRETSP